MSFATFGAHPKRLRVFAPKGVFSRAPPNLKPVPGTVCPTQKLQNQQPVVWEPFLCSRTQHGFRLFESSVQGSQSLGEKQPWVSLHKEVSLQRFLKVSTIVWQDVARGSGSVQCPKLETSRLRQLAYKLLAMFPEALSKP